MGLSSFYKDVKAVALHDIAMHIFTAHSDNSKSLVVNIKCISNIMQSMIGRQAAKNFNCLPVARPCGLETKTPGNSYPFVKCVNFASSY